MMLSLKLGARNKKKEFHGFIFVLKGKSKEIMPGQREGVSGYSIK